MVFCGTKKHNQSLKKLKLALTTVPVLQLLNFHESFTVECDASSARVGAVLLQSKHSIAFFSKEMETLLTRSTFFVKTNHFSLKHLLAQRVTTSEQQRLLMKLLPFDFTIICKAGKENQGVDGLSRRAQHDDFLALAIPVKMDFLNLQDALLNDPYTKNIITSIRQDPTTHPEFSLSDNKLFYHNRLVIPDDSSL
ncbi:retrotransposon gag domain, retroviral aspartyl protease [Tanacetum coccineum]